MSFYGTQTTVANFPISGTGGVVDARLLSLSPPHLQNKVYQHQVISQPAEQLPPPPPVICHLANKNEILLATDQSIQHFSQSR
uniref:Uncharacterized protein n=1 Tax=Ditylenchus dipsaci TaxID=166011 RepID=A0A915EEG8_9BILA